MLDNEGNIYKVRVILFAQAVGWLPCEASAAQPGRPPTQRALRPARAGPQRPAAPGRRSAAAAAAAAAGSASRVVVAAAWALLVREGVGGAAPPGVLQRPHLLPPHRPPQPATIGATGYVPPRGVRARGAGPDRLGPATGLRGTRSAAPTARPFRARPALALLVIGPAGPGGERPVRRRPRPALGAA
jgi:hypothetical protein